jgi:hypothetical protein
MLSLLFSICAFAMPSADFVQLQEQIQNSSFSSDKTSVIQLAAKNSTFEADQIKTLIKDISFTDDQLNALRILAPTLEDPSRSFVILDAFTFRSTKDEARDILSRLAPKRSLAERKAAHERQKIIEQKRAEDEERQKEEQKRERREERKETLEKEEGPLFQWVGRCIKRNDTCIRFNPKLFAPIFTIKPKNKFPKHDLILEISGPGLLHVTADLGKKYSCKKSRVIRKSQTRRIQKDISLSTGRNLINISELIPDWRREYVEIEVEKGYLSSMVRLENWRRCQ